MNKSNRNASMMALAVVAISTVSAAGNAPQGPKTRVWIDVDTHTMAGMPDMGGLGGFMMRRMGGDKGSQLYPTTRRAPTMSGQYLDIAVHNALRPGVEAQDAIPAGLDMGKSLLLLPPQREEGRTGSSHDTPPDVEFKVMEYWGCSATVRSGQPKVFTMRMKSGGVQTTGSLSQNRRFADRGIDPTPEYALWPNRKDGQRVPDGASLAGSHQISGDGIPASLKFELQHNADFMPKIALSSQGELKDAVALNWQPVERAQGYFLRAFSMPDQHTMVLWSSAEVSGAGDDLLDFLAGGDVSRGLKERVLLPTSANSCTIPKGIFAANTQASGRGGAGGMAGMGMLSMVAYGPETDIAWPPKPANPKQAWAPEWSVRVRTKSTAGAMLGMNLSGNNAQSRQDGKPPEQESTGKKLLKGLFRKF
ncbi:MAG: hypothetical protein JSR70_10885 [Proteobacteria bacterium]|nr:hypothetical protein [Pseudomonadota bacterium]